MNVPNQMKEFEVTVSCCNGYLRQTILADSRMDAMRIAQQIAQGTAEYGLMWVVEK